MKSFIKTAALSFLTVSSLTLSLPTQAFTFQSQSLEPITNQTIYRPQVEQDKSQAQVSKEEQKLSQEVPETLIAASCGYQRIRGLVHYCCVDSFGNWACDLV